MKFSGLEGEHTLLEVNFVVSLNKTREQAKNMRFTSWRSCGGVVKE
jgi:hypothetical protein